MPVEPLQSSWRAHVGDLNWQICVTLAVVAAAAIAVCRRAIAFFSGRGRSACDDCSAKSSGARQPHDGVVEEREISLFYEERND